MSTRQGSRSTSRSRSGGSSRSSGSGRSTRTSSSSGRGSGARSGTSSRKSTSRRKPTPTLTSRALRSSSRVLRRPRRRRHRPVAAGGGGRHRARHLRRGRRSRRAAASPTCPPTPSAGCATSCPLGLAAGRGLAHRPAGAGRADEVTTSGPRPRAHVARRRHAARAGGGGPRPRAWAAARRSATRSTSCRPAGGLARRRRRHPARGHPRHGGAVAVLVLLAVGGLVVLTRTPLRDAADRTVAGVRPVTARLNQRLATLFRLPYEDDDGGDGGPFTDEIDPALVPDDDTLVETPDDRRRRHQAGPSPSGARPPSSRRPSPTSVEPEQLEIALGPAAKGVAVEAAAGHAARAVGRAAGRPQGRSRTPAAPSSRRWPTTASRPAWSAWSSARPSPATSSSWAPA